MAEHDQQFDFYQQWVNKGSVWLSRRGANVHAVCHDRLGRLCHDYLTFTAAKDSNAFPVRWFWPEQIVFRLTSHDAELAAARAIVRALIDDAMPFNWHEHDDLSPGVAPAWRAALTYVGEDPNAVIAEQRAEMGFLLNAAVVAPDDAAPSALRVPGWPLMSQARNTNGDPDADSH